MFLFNAILVGFKEIWANRFRSVLTMLGIVLGVSSLVAMSAVVKGMENAMKESLIAMGGLDKVTSEEQDVPAEQQHLADQAVKRSIRDVMALKNTAHMLKVVSPEMELDRAIITRGDKRARPSELVGVWPAVLDMNLHTVEHGRFFTDMDEELASPVIVIGTGIRDELFGSPLETGEPVVPLGEVVQINGQAFTIVGMFEHYEGEQDRKMREEMERRAKETKPEGGVERRRGWGNRRWSPFYRKNMTAYIPLNTMWLRFRSATGEGDIPDPSLTEMDVKIRDLSRIEDSLQQAKNVMMITHNGVENFSFNTQEGNIEEIDTNIRNARRSGGLIAGIALLVGGIGIMNIMLASITERIREIGIRKAIGASTPAIFLQILVESVVISVLGGILGVFCSYGFVNLLTRLTPSQTTPEVTFASLAMAFCFSVGVGIIAGITPAIKAARLHPIQALRFD